MNNAKIGNKEAIALLVTITFNHIILNITKTIIDTTDSASILNLLYISIITIIFTCIICYFLNKFPTSDIVDISKYLGGNILKWIIGLAYIAYFIFFAGALLHTGASALQIVYYPLTKIFYIILFFVIGAIIIANMKNNAIYRSTFILFPVIVTSLIFLFLSDTPYFNMEKIYPIFGNGIHVTFLTGISNMFAFQALGYIYFMPPILKEQNQLKKIAVNSIVLSSIFLILSVSIILLMFYGSMDTDEFFPLYSATQYIEYGSFFRRLDSLFVLIWVISFLSFLGIALHFSSNIFKKLTNVENKSFFVYLLGFALLLASIWPKNHSISNFCIDTLYKYAFFILIIGISFLILFLARIKQKKGETSDD